MFRLICFLFILLLSSSGLSAQDFNAKYKPLDYSRVPLDTIYSYKKKFGDWRFKTSFRNNKATYEFTKFAAANARFFYSLDSAYLLMFDDTITAYLNQIKNEIIAANDSLKDYNCRVYVFRSVEPNAYNLGEGIILFSLGLLERFSTKEQIAFILAHEIAHDVLDHVYLTKKRLISEMYESGLHRSLRRAWRTPMGRNTSFKLLIDNFMQRNLSYRRADEVAADSLGFALFINAGLKSEEAFRALEILDVCDQMTYTDTLKLENIFNDEEFPFRVHWYDSSNSAAYWKPDSAFLASPDLLRTHPDCEIRIQNLKKISTGSSSNEVNEGRVLEIAPILRNAISFETLNSIMLSQDYALGLYYALHLMLQFPENEYIKTVISHCLAELSLSLRNNQFLEYVQFPDQDFSKGYNQLLRFLHNMNSSTLDIIASRFMETHLSHLDDPYISFIKLVRNSENGLNYADIENFEKTYPDNYLIKLLKEKWIAGQF